MSDAPAPSALTRAEVLDLLEELKGVYSVRNAEYAHARALYDGEHWGDNVDNPAPQGYSLVANYVRPTVDNAVTDLLSRMPGIQVMPRGVDETARRVAEGCEGVLYAMWERNDAPDVFRRVLFNAVLYRRGILHYWWDPSEQVVRFKSFNPFNFYPVYDGDEVVECVAVSRRLTRQLKRMYPKLASQITPDTDPAESYDPDGLARTSGGIMDALNDGGEVDGRRQLSGYTTVIDWYDAQGNWMRLMGEATHRQRLSNKLTRVPFIEVAPKVTGDEVEPGSEVVDIMELNQYYDQLLSQQANIIKKYSDPTILDIGTGVDPVRIKRTVSADGGVLPIRKDGNLRFLNWEGTPPEISAQFERVENIIRDLSGRPRSSYGEMATNQSGVMTNLAMNPTTTAAENRATMLGAGMIKLHEGALCLYEEHASGKDLSYAGYRPKGRYGTKAEYFESSLKGSEIQGWYRNQIKWPSRVRTDDPVFIQNIQSRVTSEPPTLPIYDAIEMFGHDDAEALLDRLAAQREDPRWHPEVLSNAIDAASSLQGLELPTDMEGFDSSTPIDGAGPMNEALEAGGSPYREDL